MTFLKSNSRRDLIDMKVLVNIGHPAHVHLFKNTIWGLEKDGHRVMITAIDKEMTFDLLDAYGFEYESLGNYHQGLLSQAIGLVIIDYKLYRVVRSFKPDIMIAGGSPYPAHVAKLLRKPFIAFDDTDHAKLILHLYSPATI